MTNFLLKLDIDDKENYSVKFRDIPAMLSSDFMDCLQAMAISLRKTGFMLLSRKYLLSF